MLKKRRVAFIIVVLFALIPISATAQSVYVRDKENNLTQPPLPPKTVILTFDDGPSQYTPEVLKILKEKHVKATFFVVGSQAIGRPLLKQIYDEGHEIGNHTYTHLDLSKAPNWRMKLELNLTRIIITSQINHSTRLFRPPLLGSNILRPEAASVVNRALDLGYIGVGETIDSQDWQRPGVQKIITNVTSGNGGIILLHDGGGDRTQTVKALPTIIDSYQKRGFEFMTASQALNLSRRDVMPPLSPAERLLALVGKLVSAVIVWGGRFLRGFMLLLIVAGFARFLLVTLTALIQSRRKFQLIESVHLPCSVIIPAYNEAAVIQSCIKSVLASDYAHFEVLVIDDGSTDNTYELASEITDRRLHVLRKKNNGKASALNYGITHARAPFFIAIDADTVFKTDTMAKLMRHFLDKRVGAVSGNTKIVNRHKLITKLQSLEYIVGFNMDRRMGDLFDCVTVVPGAVGAFSRSVVQKVGCFRLDTLAEDTDLTLSIKEAGYKIAYDAEAMALTEAPATLRDLLRQRFRWTFGTLQAVWKHKRSVMNPRYGSLGIIGLPYLLLFQIIFPLLSPLFDVALVLGFLGHQYKLIIIGFVVYTVIDVATAWVALRLDNEKLSSLWILVPQRFFYRQLMYYVIARSFINVLKGRLVHWGKLEREGDHLAKNV